MDSGPSSSRPRDDTMPSSESPEYKKQKRRPGSSSTNSRTLPIPISRLSVPPCSPPPAAKLNDHTPTLAKLHEQIKEMKSATESFKEEIAAGRRTHWDDLVKWGKTFAGSSQDSIEGVAEGASAIAVELAELKERVEVVAAVEQVGRCDGCEALKKDTDAKLQEMARLLRQDFTQEVVSLHRSVATLSHEAKEGKAALEVANAKIVELEGDINRYKVEHSQFRLKNALAELERVKGREIQKVEAKQTDVIGWSSYSLDR